MSFSFLENHVRGDFNSAHAEKKTDQYWKDVTACTQLLAGNLREEIPQLPHVRCMHMAFMIPVVRNDWDVWMGSGKPRPSGKSSRNGQNAESRSDDTSLATTPNPSSGIFLESAHRKRSLAIEIRNQQHLRFSGGSLPSSFQSAHLTIPLSGASPRYRRPRSSTPRFHSVHSSYRIGNNRVSEPESPLSPAKADDTVTASLPVSSEGVSPPIKVGSQNSLQKFHTRLVDRLRRSLRLHSSSTSDGGGETCDGDNGSRASS